MDHQVIMVLQVLQEQVVLQVHQVQMEQVVTTDKVVYQELLVQLVPQVQ